MDYDLASSGDGVWAVGYQFRSLDHKGNFLYESYNLNTSIWEVEPKYSSNLNLKRNIHSGYVEYSGKKDRLTYGFGIRAEIMDRELDYLGRTVGSEKELLTYNYFKLFPSLNMLVELKDDLILKAGYTKRVERTTTFKMNPFKEKEHSETLEQGDANLLPEFIDVVELGIVKNFGNNSINATGYFRSTKNLINRVNTVDSDSVLNRIYTNVGTGEAFGIEIGADLKINDWWKIFAGTNIYHYAIDGAFNDRPVNSKAWQYSFNLNSSFDFGKTWDLQWSLSYLSKRITAQGQDSQFYLPSLAIRKSFLDDKITASVQWLNMDLGILNTNEQRISTSGEYTDSKDGLRKAFFTTTNYVYEVDMVMINLNYKFNQLKSKAKFVDSEFGKKEF